MQGCREFSGWTCLRCAFCCILRVVTVVPCAANPRAVMPSARKKLSVSAMHLLLLHGLALLGVFLTAGCDTAEPPEPEYRIQFTGVVTDSTSGKPLENVRVAIGIGLWPFPSWKELDADTTDHLGSYEIVFRVSYVEGRFEKLCFSKDGALTVVYYMPNSATERELTLGVNHTWGNHRIDISCKDQMIEHNVKL